jgi:hypothetical protein
VLPLGELAGPHPLEQVEVLLDGTVTVGAFLSRSGLDFFADRLSTYALPFLIRSTAYSYNWPK